MFQAHSFCQKHDFDVTLILYQIAKEKLKKNHQVWGVCQSIVLSLFCSNPLFQNIRGKLANLKTIDKLFRIWNWDGCKDGCPNEMQFS